MAQLNKQQIEQLWLQAGGSSGLADTMSAIALAESSGRTDALNNDPSTGDYSVSLWQINYFGNLLASRTARYGSPQQLLADPLRAARAAVSLAAGGRGLSNWTTYTSGAYRQYLTGGNSSASSAAAMSRPRPGSGADASSSQPVSWYDWIPLPNLLGPLSPLESAWEAIAGNIGGAGGVLAAPWDALKLFIWLSQPKTWLRIFETLLGLGLIGVSLAGLAKLLSGGQAKLAVPGGAAIKAAFPEAGLIAGASGGGGGKRRRSSSSSSSRRSRPRSTGSKRPPADELAAARTRTETERTKEVRARRRQRLEQARELRREREKRERSAYFRGAADASR